MEKLDGKVTQNEQKFDGINWCWFCYPSLEECLEGLKIRSPEEYKGEIEHRKQGKENPYCVLHNAEAGIWEYRLHY